VAYDYDLVVIGSGPAGEKGAAQAAYFGKRVAVIERAPAPGGAAVHTGTLPSKTLRETAIFLSGHRAAALYGINVSLDKDKAVPRLMSSKDHVVDAEVERIHWNLDRHHVSYLRGKARIADPHTVEIEAGRAGEVAKRVTAEFILVATGSTPFQPPEIPFDDPDIDDSDSILHMDRLPDSLGVIGAGVIGCEYACMFAALGCKVTLVEPRDELLSFLDADMSEALRVAMIESGIDVRLQTTAGNVRRAGDYIVIDLTAAPKSPDAGKPPKELAVEKLLFAAGRSGNTAGLGLEGAATWRSTRTTARRRRPSTRPATSSASPRSPPRPWSRRASPSATRSASPTSAR
jgi:NAD(P) transhydrogenase